MHVRSCIHAYICTQAAVFLYMYVYVCILAAVFLYMYVFGQLYSCVRMYASPGGSRQRLWPARARRLGCLDESVTDVSYMLCLSAAARVKILCIYICMLVCMYVCMYAFM